jgi:hypothetical protein
MKRRGEEGRWGEWREQKTGAHVRPWPHLYALGPNVEKTHGGGSESQLWNQSEKWTFDGCIFGLLLLTSFPACATGNLDHKVNPRTELRASLLEF